MSYFGTCRHGWGESLALQTSLTPASLTQLHLYVRVCVSALLVSSGILLLHVDRYDQINAQEAELWNAWCWSYPCDASSLQGMLETGLPLVWDEPQTTSSPSDNGQTKRVVCSHKYSCQSCKQQRLVGILLYEYLIVVEKGLYKWWAKTLETLLGPCISLSWSTVQTLYPTITQGLAKDIWFSLKQNQAAQINWAFLGWLFISRLNLSCIIGD